LERDEFNLIREPTGEDIYNSVVAGNPSEMFESNLMPRKMNDFGVKGIQYNDAMSRGGTQGGTKNYVTFDDKLMKIVDKYGVAGLTTAIGTGIAAGYSPKGTAGALYTPEQNKAYADKLKALGRPDLIPTDDRIEGAKYPGLGTAADYLRNADTPIGQYIESTPNVLDAWSYGEKADPLDILMAVGEVVDPSTYLAGAVSTANAAFKKSRKKKRKKKR
jgi:hypothetical protein